MVILFVLYMTWVAEWLLLGFGDDTELQGPDIAGLSA